MRDVPTLELMNMLQATVRTAGSDSVAAIALGRELDRRRLEQVPPDDPPATNRPTLLEDPVE